MLTRRSVPLLLIAGLLLAAGLRLHRLEAQSLWNDEGNSARLAERDPAAIIAGAGGDIHPPGYYLLLAGWRALGGPSEFSLRLFSALASVLAAAALYALIRQAFSRRAAALALLLAALSPFQVYYGQEARMYALTALLSALSMALVVRVLSLPAAQRAGRFDRRRAAAVLGGYVLVNTLGLYTHYSFPLTLAAQSGVWAIWLARRVRAAGPPRRLPILRHGLAVWIGLQGAALLLFAPWIPRALRQIAGWPRGGGGPVDALTALGTLAYGPTLPPESAAVGLLPLLLLAGAGLLRPPDDPPRYLRYGERAGLLLAWLAVPPLSLSLAGALSGPFLKFLLPANLALLGLAAQGVVTWLAAALAPRPAARQPSADPLLLGPLALLAALALIPGARALRHLYADPAYARDDYRAIAARIRAEAGPQAAVILDAPNQWEVFTYYYPDGPGVTPLPRGDSQAALDRLLAAYGRIYVLYWGEAQQDPQGIVRRGLEARAFEADSQWYGGVQLVTYAVTGGPAREMVVRSGARLGDPPAIWLDGYTVSEAAAAPGDGLGVTLFWGADAPIAARLKVFVHLLGPDGTLVAQHDSEPANNRAPTDGWQPGVVVVDPHGLLIPLDAPPGEYRLTAGLYLPDGTRLPVSVDGQPAGDSVDLGAVTIR